MKYLVLTLTIAIGIAHAQTVIKRDLGCSPATASGTTYACNISPAPAALVTNETYYIVADVPNTGTTTINFNSFGAKTIKTPAGGVTNLIANDIRAGQIVVMRYDGTNMQMVSQSGNAPSGSGDVVAAGTNTFTGTNTVGSGGSFAPSGTGTVKATDVVSSAGAAPTADGKIAVDSTAHTLKFGSNGSTKTAMDTATSVVKAQTPLTTKGDLWVTDGTSMHRLAAGTDTFVLTADATQTDGVKWAAGGGSSTVTDNIRIKAAGAYHGSGTVALWDIPTSGGPDATLDNSLSGTTYAFQALNYQDTSAEQFAVVPYTLHDSWTGNVNVTLETMGGSATGNALWKIYTACTSTGAMNPLTYNAANTTTATYGGSFQRVAVTFTNITMTGCSAGNFLSIKVARDSTSGSDTLVGAAYATAIVLKMQHN